MFSPPRSTDHSTDVVQTLQREQLCPPSRRGSCSGRAGPHAQRLSFVVSRRGVGGLLRSRRARHDPLAEVDPRRRVVDDSLLEPASDDVANAVHRRVVVKHREQLFDKLITAQLRHAQRVSLHELVQRVDRRKLERAA